MAAKNRTSAWVLPLCLIAAAALPAAAHAQAWVPQRHVEFVAPTAAGSSMDNITRTVERLTRELKLLPVSSAVANRPGGEHAVAYTFLKQRTGDPHFVGITSQVLLTNHIAGILQVTYTDVTPISMLLSEHYIAIVHKDSPIKTAKDLVETLRQKPESLSIAVGNLSQRMAVGLVLQAGKVDLKRARIATITGGKMVLSVAGGHVDVAMASIGAALPLVDAGMLRVVGVSGPKRIGGLFASAPTWAESGYPNAAFVAWRGVLAPHGITPAQIAYWEGVMRRVAESDEMRTVAERHQWEVSFKDAAETGKFMEEEYGRLKQVMTSMGLMK
ncbi:MAG: tripartite tricarboxylate transporter substrate binding protein [Burkholderiales bacterium]